MRTCASSFLFINDEPKHPFTQLKALVYPAQMNHLSWVKPCFKLDKRLL